jgi:glutaredoxin
MIDSTGCTITLYTQDRCAASARVRAWLVQEQIPFSERDVTSDPAAAEALAATGVFATPLVTICTHTVFGNRPAAIARTIETCEFRRTA